jgi:hypothetical protein
MADTYDAIPKTCAEALRRWDAGDPVFTVEMGGFGPGYEQAIHICVFEIVRDQLAEGPLPEFGKDDDAALQNWWSTWGDAAISRSNAAVGGYSGAQVGAAKSLAYRYLRDGWAVTVNSVDDDRKTQVSKYWPGVVPVSTSAPTR